MITGLTEFLGMVLFSWIAQTGIFCSIRCYSHVSGAQVWRTGLVGCIELGLRFLTV